MEAAAERAKKKKECGQLKNQSLKAGANSAISSKLGSAIGSGAAAASATADMVGGLLSWVPRFGEFAKAAGKGASVAAYGFATNEHVSAVGYEKERLGLDQAIHDKGCSNIPFEELTTHVDERFDKTDGKIDRNLNAIENNSKSLDRNLDAINNVGTKVDRNYRGIENNLKAINRNAEALERNHGAIKENFQAIKENHSAIKQNYQEIKHVSAQVDRNLGAIERNFDQLKVNQGEIRLVGGKVDRNYGAITQVSAQVDRNLDAIERNFDQLKINEGVIRLVDGKVDRNYGAITQVSAQVDRNLDVIERNFDQLKINEGEIRLVDGKVDRNYGAITQVSAQVDRNLDAIRDNLKIMTGNYHAIRQNNAAIQLVAQKVDRNLDNLVENYRVTKQNLDAANRNYLAISRVEDKIDRYYSVMLSGFKYIVDKIDQTKAEMNKRFDRLEQLLDTSRKEEAVSQIIAFFETFSFELDGVRNLNHDRLIEKLEAKDGTLSLLKSVRNPSRGNLYNDLKSIIRQGLAIPSSSDDKMSFIVLDLLHSGTELYVSVLYSLVRSYIYLAVDYYEKNDVDKYNQYLSELEITTRAFVDSLIGISGNVGLIDEVNAINDRVIELEFIKEDKEYLLDIMAKRRNDLQSIRSNLEELIERLPIASPAIRIRFDFSKSNVTSSIGEWKNGGKVSYAIHSEKKDGSNYVKVSDWVSYDVRDKAMPLLNIGAAPTGERRSIFRRFNGKDKPELVGTIEDHNQSEFRDISQDLYNAVMKQNEEVALSEIELLIKDGADINVEYRNEGYIMNVAAKQGNLNILSSLIKNGADIEARDVEGNTPIHIATQNGFKSLVETLIDRGADVNAGNDLNFTPVHAAARNGDAELFTLLLQKGARANSTTSDGYTPLHAAVASGRDNIVDMLLKQGSEIAIESTTNQGFTPLHLAAAAGHDSLIRALLRGKKTNVNARAKRGTTPLHLASMSGNLSTVKVLLAARDDDKIRPNEQTDDGLSALHLAIYFRKDKVVTELLKIADLEVSSTTRDGLTALHIASKENQQAVVTALLNKGASPDERDLSDYTPLHLAAERGHLEVVRALNDAATGVNLNVRCSDGRTPLQLAIIKNRSDVVQYLIEKGARINTKDTRGASSLDYGIQTGKSDMVKAIVEAYKREHYILDGALRSAAHNGNLRIIKFLVHDLSILDFNSRDRNGNTPIHFAALQGRQDIVRYLADAGADLSANDNRGDGIMHFAALGGDKATLEYLVGRGINVDGVDNYNVTPLHLASFIGHANSIKYLLQAGNGTGVNWADTNGNTALHYLAAQGRTADSNAGIVKYMTENRANIELPNKEGYTPLLLFARSGKWSAVRFLVKKYTGSDSVNVRDENGWSPVFWATRYGNLNVVKMLIDEVKADYSSPDKQGLSILHVAILSGNLDLLKYLVEEKKVSINVSDNGSSLPLHLAAELGRLEMVEYLVKNRASKNAQDTSKLTPMLRAAKERHWDVVNYLIKNGANRRIADKDNNSLAHRCAEGGNLEIMKSLNDSELNMRNNRDETPLHLAAMNDNLDIIKYLVGDRKVSGLQDRDKLGNTPLHYAASAGELGTLKYLIERGSDPSATNVAGKNPCDLCSKLSIAKYLIDEKEVGYNSHAFGVVENGSLGILKYLVEEQQLNPGLVDGNGKSLLHHAAMKGKIDIVKYLVGNKRVDARHRDKSSKTPQYYALLNGHPEVVDYLDEMDNKQVIDYGDQTIFDVAKGGNAKMVEFLIDKMADTDQRVSSGKTKLESVLATQDPDSGYTLLHYAVALGNLRLVKRLVEFGASTNSRNADGRTPLEIAAKDQQEIAKYLMERAGIDDIFTAVKQGNLAIVKTFIEGKKASIDARDKDNKTVLDHAIDHGHVEIIKYLLDERGATYEGDIFTAIGKNQLGMVRYFVEVKKLDLDTRNKLDANPLLWAAGCGQLNVVKYLIEQRGQSMDSRSSNGWSPLHWAVYNDRFGTVKYLAEKGGNVNAKTNDNKTSLDLAIAKNNTELIKYLMDERGVVYEGDIFTAAKKGHLGVVKYFIDDKKQDPDSRDKGECNALHQAAAFGHLDIVEYLIGKRAELIKSVDDTGWTPLLYAAYNGHPSVVRYLLEHGANVNAKDTSDRTPLFFAIAKDHTEIINLLAERGAAYNGDIFTAAEKGQLGMVKYFIEAKGQNVNSQDNLGWTPLHRAAYFGRINLVKYLVEEKRANFNSQNKYKFTPSHAAAEKGNLDVLKYLAEKGADINAKDNSNNGPLDYAIDKNQQEVIKYLIDERGATHEGDIFAAAEKGQLGMVKYFIEAKGQNVNSQDNLGWTPLLKAAYFGHINLVKYLVEEKHANMNTQNKENSAPLHAAAEKGNLDILKYLVEKGADVKAMDGSSRTPLDIAIRDGRSGMIKYLTEDRGVALESNILVATEKGQLAMVKYLMQKNNLTAKSEGAWDVLSKAAASGHLDIVKYLIEEKRLSTESTTNGSTALAFSVSNGHLGIVKYLAYSGANINAKTKNGETPLELAIAKGNTEIIKYLDERGAAFEGDIFTAVGKGQLGMVRYFVEVKKLNLDTWNKEGWNPLHWAAGNGQLGIVKYLIEERGQSIESKDKIGESPLHWAVHNGRLNTVKYLVEKGVDINAKMNGNRTPLDLAIANNNTELIKYLDERGAAFEGDIFTVVGKGQLGMVRYFVEVKKLNPDARNKEGYNPLHWAAYNGQLDIVKYLIEERGQSIESKDIDSWSPLHWAVLNGRLSTVKYLAEKGGNVNAKMNDGRTPLDLAIFKGGTEIIKYLDERGAAFESDIFIAVGKGQLGMVRYLVEMKNLNLDTRNNLDANPLLWAAGCGKLDIVKYLIEERGQSMESKSSNGWSPLHWAVYNDRFGTVKYLAEKGGNVNAKTNDNKTPLDLAIDQKNTEMINYLSGERGATLEGDIFSAAEKGQLSMVKYFAEVRKQNLESTTNEHGANILHIAAWKNKLDIVKYLVEEKRMNPNTLDNRGRSPLHEAAATLDLDLVKYLVEKGARVHVKARDGKTTPLLSALESKRGKSSVTDYLCTFYSSCMLQCHVSTFSSNCMAFTTMNHRPFRSINYDHSADILGDTPNLIGYSESGSGFDYSSSVRMDDDTDSVRRGFAPAPVSDSSRAESNSHANDDEHESRVPRVTESGTGSSSDLNGTLLALTLLSKLPIVGRFFPEVKLASNGGPELSAPMSMAESMGRATEATVKLEKMLNESAVETNVPVRDLQLDSFALSSELAHHLRRGSEYSELSKLLYSHAERASMNNSELIDLVKVKLPNLVETLNVSRSSDRLAAKAREIAQELRANSTLQNMLGRDLEYLSRPPGANMTMMVDVNSGHRKL